MESTGAVLGDATTGIAGYAATIVGLDIDPIAVKNAQENAMLNGVSAQCRFFVGTLAAVQHGPFPLIYANLQKHIILPMLPNLATLMQPGEELLISGILRDEEEQMRQALAEFSFAVAEVVAQDEWILMECTKHAHRRS